MFLPNVYLLFRLSSLSMLSSLILSRGTLSCQVNTLVYDPGIHATALLRFCAGRMYDNCDNLGPIISKSSNAGLSVDARRCCGCCGGRGNALLRDVCSCCSIFAMSGSQQQKGKNNNDSIPQYPRGISNGFLPSFWYE